MLTHSLCVCVHLWFVCCTQIDIVYLFLIASVKQNRPLHQEPGRIIATLAKFLRFVDSTASGWVHLQNLVVNACDLCSFDFANLSDWITFCCIHQQQKQKHLELLSFVAIVSRIPLLTLSVPVLLLAIWNCGKRNVSSIALCSYFCQTKMYINGKSFRSL